jgi:hypothetical protein
MITPSEVNWVREQIEERLLGADEEPPVIDEELLERCLLSNDWLHPSGEKYIGNRWKVKWSEQATNLLAMKARGIPDRRCAEHFGVAAGRVAAVKNQCHSRLRDLALLGDLTRENTPSDNGDIAAFAKINAQNNAPMLRTLSRSGDRTRTIEWRKDIPSDEILMALGFNSDGTIREQWSELRPPHQLYGSAAYEVAFKEWERRASWHFSPQHAILEMTNSNRELLAEIGTKLDRALAALEESRLQHVKDNRSGMSLVWARIKAKISGG